MKNSSFCTVVFPDMPGREFTYKIPGSMELRPGMRAVLPFKKTKKNGFIKEIDTIPPDGVKNIRAVYRAVEPAASHNMVRLAQWISEYYDEDAGRVFSLLYPPGSGLKTVEKYRFVSNTTGFDEERDKYIGGSFEKREFLKDSGMGEKEFNKMIQEGLITAVHAVRRSGEVKYVTTEEKDCEKIEKRAHAQRRELHRLISMGGEAPLSEFKGSIIRALMDKGLVSKETREPEEEIPGFSGGDIRLSAEQEQVFQKILKKGIRGFSAHLIHGVTGSGKTELYMKIMEEVIREGRDVIYLVPEIALTTHLLERIKAAFGERVVLTHGYMSPARRNRAWFRAGRGRGTIVVGPRSAVFAPLPGLGLIVVDEEHESTFKQDETPRYNGRDTAVYRARIEDVPVVLGSATPSMESYYNSVNGKYMLHEIKNRYSDAVLPRVDIVDISKDVFQGGKLYPFSERMLAGIRERISRGEQSIIFLNRKGYDTHFICRKCGAPAQCRHCSKMLTNYKTEGLLRCNLCGYTVEPGEYACEECGSRDFEQRGTGTEKVAEKLQSLIPEAEILRVDGSVTRNFETVKQVFQAFGRGRGNILIGTQIIAKGIHFENVTLVGVVNADSMMNLPDFRANERTYQLISQVTGRSGRGRKPGVSLIQTYSPGHYVLQSALEHDFREFYRRESAIRQELSYPPFNRLVRIILENRDRSSLERETRVAQSLLDEEFAQGGRVSGGSWEIQKKTDR